MRKAGIPLFLYVVISCVVGIVVLSCDSDSTTEPKVKISVNDTRISDCGGFKELLKRSADSTIPFTRDPATYCEAEQLLWNYNSDTRQLKLMNARVYLNCCGDHEITAEMEEGILTVRENDQPEDGTGRCRCMCVYDFYIAIDGVSPGVTKLDLFLRVDDTTTKKWGGEIDLPEGYGEIIVVDKALESGCP